MTKKAEAIIKQDGDWWIGWIEEISGVNCREAMREELLESLKITSRSVEIYSSGCAFGGGCELSGAGNCDVKRRELLRYLTTHGCELLREGGNHSQNKRSAIPRHNEITD